MAEQKINQNMDNPINNSGKNTGMSKKKKIFITLTFLVLLTIIGILLYFLLNKPSDKPNLVVTKENKDTITDELAGKVAAGMFEVEMNTIWNFETAESPSINAYIANAESNTSDITFEVTVDETGDVVLKSPVIPVGSSLKNLTLEKKLKPGKYPATVKYHLIDADGKEKSSVAFAIELNILK